MSRCRWAASQAAVAFYKNASTPNLIIIESLLDRTDMLGELDRLAEVCDPGTKVIVIGHVNDVLLYRELLRRGVSEYVVAPVKVLQIIESISAIYTDPETGPVGQVIAFVGAKGGSGSSTVCHNTAFAIASSLKSDVVIADFDLPFGTAGLDFNQDPLQGIADALASPERLDEMVLDRLLSRCSDHLSLFAAPGTLDRPYDLDPAYLRHRARRGARERAVDRRRRAASVDGLGQAGRAQGRPCGDHGGARSCQSAQYQESDRPDQGLAPQRPAACCW